MNPANYYDSEYKRGVQWKTQSHAIHGVSCPECGQPRSAACIDEDGLYLMSVHRERNVRYHKLRYHKFQQMKADLQKV